MNIYAERMVAKRGPRWAVVYRVRPDEDFVRYADTAEQAEMIRSMRERDGYYNVRVHPPEGSINLRAIGRELGEARAAEREAAAKARSAAIQAAEEGRAEAEIARQLGVDRMTVRAWLGKRK